MRLRILYNEAIQIVKDTIVLNINGNKKRKERAHLKKRKGYLKSSFRASADALAHA